MEKGKKNTRAKVLYLPDRNRVKRGSEKIEIKTCVLPEPWINRRVEVLREDKTSWLESWNKKWRAQSGDTCEYNMKIN